MQQIYTKTIQALAGFSATLLLDVLLLYTSDTNPVVLGRYSIRYLLVVAIVITFYLFSITFLLKTGLLRKKGFQNALLFALSLIIMVLLAEIGFRAMDGFGFVRGSEIEQWLRQVRQNQPYTYCGARSRKEEFCVSHENNSLGFNDKEYALEKSPGVYRILVLGDSYVEALQVELEDTFHKLIEAQLNTRGLRVEVIALGRASVGTVQELETLKEVGLSYSPDLVILAFLAANDVRDNSPILNERYFQANTSLTPPGLKKFFRARFDLAYFAADMIDRFYTSQKDPIPFDFQVFDPDKFESDPEWQEAWEITFEAILQMQKIIKKRGIDFLVVSFTSRPEIASYQSQSKLREVLRTPYRAETLADHYDFQLPDRLMADFTRQNGIPYLQLNPVFAEMRQQDGADIEFHFVYDGHWNERGHQAAAEAILDNLDSNFLQAMRQ
jgi:hypothetical protein